MVRVTSVLSLTTLVLFAYAQEDAIHKALGLLRTPTNLVPTLNARTVADTCQGTCAQCFGTGYTNCPGSDYYCYKAGDPEYGLDSCTPSTVLPSTATTANVPASTSASAPASTATGPEFCYQKGATCVSCFGAGYLQCSDGITCYNPNDPQYDTCPTATASAGGSTSTSSCAQQYGTGSIPCGDDACYNPGEGDVCCSDGYHCEGGYSCSTIVGKCCAPGSTKSGCSGSGGLLTSTTRTATSFSYAPASTQSAEDLETTSEIPTATTTRAFIGTTSRASSATVSTSTSTSSSTPPVTDISTGGAARVYISGVMSIAGAAFGMLVVFL